MILTRLHQSNLFYAWYLTAEIKIKDAVTRLGELERMRNYFKLKLSLPVVIIYSAANSEDHACHPVSNAQKVMNYSADHPTCLSFSLWWQSALFRKLDWNVWGLIYRSRMNTWMWSSAIFHTHPTPSSSTSDGILLPLPQKVAEGTVFHLNKHYGVMLNIIHHVRSALTTPWNIFCADLRFLLK